MKINGKLLFQLSRRKILSYKPFFNFRHKAELYSGDVVTSFVNLNKKEKASRALISTEIPLRLINEDGTIFMHNMHSEDQNTCYSLVGENSLKGITPLRDRISFNMNFIIYQYS